MPHHVTHFPEARAKKRWRGAIHRARFVLLGAAVPRCAIPHSSLIIHHSQQVPFSPFPPIS
jgi:hypothetical protein